MKKTFLLGTLTALTLAGCGEAFLETEGNVKPEIDVGHEKIVNGTVDNGHPTVGKVRDNGDEICTGTLVGAKTVITAAHCIESTTASRYAFILGSTAYPANSVTVHPSWDGNADSGEGKYDIAVIVLKTSPNITPTPVATAAPFVGQEVTLVGFGVTGENYNNYGTKRITTNNLSKVVATKIYWMPSGGVGTTCYGDSGGPAFANVNGQEVLLGVTSGGESPCETGYSWDTRVDYYVSWISSVTGGDVVKAGSNTCTPSCSGKSCGSDGCGGTCGTCGTGTTCNASFQCVSTGGGTTGGAVTENVSGSVAKSASKYFGPYTVVPGSNFSVAMTGTGDADLYVRFGSKPTASSYDCRPYLDGSTESCSLTVPAGKTTAYIMVKGYTASSFNLVITYTKTGTSTGGTTGTGTAMTAAADGSVNAGQSVNYSPITVVANTTFKVVMSGSGDADLYVRFGAAPTTSTYACRPYLDGSAETCSVTVPAGQTQAYIMVNGYAASTYHLEIAYTAP
ncbi:MAG: trypsin-like serine protease [Myxococcales bacterium]